MQEEVFSSRRVAWFFIGHRVMRIIKLYNMETAFIHIKMNITLLKVWRVRFPDFYVRVFCFNHLPYFLPNSTTVAIRIDVE